MTGLRAWFDKLMGRAPKADEPPPARSEPSKAPSEGPLTEEEQMQRDKADEPADGPEPDSLNA